MGWKKRREGGKGKDLGIYRIGSLYYDYCDLVIYGIGEIV